MSKFIPLMEAASQVNQKKYKCPYCDDRLIRTQLANHIQKSHEDMIPEGYTALRVAFNTINKKTEGHCIICREVTAWNESKGRYERLCGRQACKDAYAKQARDRIKDIYGTDCILKDPRYREEQQKKMLANRKISGKYKFRDGGLVGYVGSYEKKLLQFMDSPIMNIESEDVVSPGPIIHYMYKGEEHMYISDFLYAPYNLIIEVKDGGSNPNGRPMEEYREKQLAKEKAIISDKKYNYLRLTNNDFNQLLEIMAVLKYTFMEDPDQIIVRINEASALNEASSDKNADAIEKGIKDKVSYKKARDNIYLVVRNRLYSDDHKYHKENWLYVFTPDNKIAGELMMYNKNTELYSIETKPKYRNHGYATQLIICAVNDFGSKLLSITMANENGPAHKLYLKLGFKEYDRGKDYIYLRIDHRIAETAYKHESEIDETIRAALVPCPTPEYCNKDNYYIIKHQKDDDSSCYSITKDPTQNTFVTVSPKGNKISNMTKDQMPGSYITFKLKDQDKAEETYQEALAMLGQEIDDTEYFYKKYTGRNVLTEDQILFDDTMQMVPNFTNTMDTLCESIEKYITEGVY